MERKNLKLLMLLVAVTALTVVTASASSGGSDSTAAITNAFQSGFQGIVDSSISMIAVIVPIALSLAAVIFGVKKAISWFKSVAK